MLGDWYTGDQYRRMLTVGDTFKAIYNKTEGYKHEIIRWDHVESCYASDHWNCKYKTDCNVTKKFRCQEDHRIAIEFDQFDGLNFSLFYQFLMIIFSSYQKRR